MWVFVLAIAVLVAVFIIAYSYCDRTALASATLALVAAIVILAAASSISSSQTTLPGVNDIAGKFLLGTLVCLTLGIALILALFYPLKRHAVIDYDAYIKYKDYGNQARGSTTQ